MHDDEDEDTVRGDDYHMAALVMGALLLWAVAKERSEKGFVVKGAAQNWQARRGGW